MAGRPRTVSNAAILQGASQVLSRLGPARMSLADVAREAGLSPATLVQRFGSKRGLLLALAHSGRDTTRDAFTAARSARGPLAALYEALARITADMATPEALSRHLAFLQVDLAEPEFREAAVGHADVLLEEIWLLLEEAAAGGELQPADTARLAEAVYIAYNGALVTWAIRRDGDLASALWGAVSFALQPYLALPRADPVRAMLE